MREPHDARGVVAVGESEQVSDLVDDLVDDTGMLTDSWGYCWMILAEKRGLLTPENRAAARAAIEEKYLSSPNVIGVIVGR